MIHATTFLTLLKGASIEVWADEEPKEGEQFNIKHADTKKIIHRAGVLKWKKVKNRYLVTAKIIK